MSRSKLEHNHVSDEQKVQRLCLTQSGKRKATENISDAPRKILRKVLQEYDNDAIDTSDLLKIKRNMYNARRKIFPALPKNILDIHNILKTFEVKTSKDEDFLLLNDELNNLIIFACSTNLNCLTQSEIIYLDGTFSYWTKFFKQL